MLISTINFTLAVDDYFIIISNSINYFILVRKREKFPMKNNGLILGPTGLMRWPSTNSWTSRFGLRLAASCPKKLMAASHSSSSSSSPLPANHLHQTTWSAAIPPIIPLPPSSSSPPFQLGDFSFSNPSAVVSSEVCLLRNIRIF